MIRVSIGSPFFIFFSHLLHIPDGVITPGMSGFSR
jgi:hypothetical protein